MGNIEECCGESYNNPRTSGYSLPSFYHFDSLKLKGLLKRSARGEPAKNIFTT